MKRFFMSLTMLAAVASLFAFQAVALSTTKAANTPVVAGAMVPVTFTSGTKSFTGNFNITRFVAEGGALKAVGNLVGTVTDTANTNGGGAVNQALTLPVILGANGTTATCDILHLVLGPLNLSVLGLNIDLSQIVLDITATQGSGNLLGNLLCSVAKLLDKGGPLNGIAGLLNNILRNL